MNHANMYINTYVVKCDKVLLEKKCWWMENKIKKWDNGSEYSSPSPTELVACPHETWCRSWKWKGNGAWWGNFPNYSVLAVKELND